MAASHPEKEIRLSYHRPREGSTAMAGQVRAKFPAYFNRFWGSVSPHHGSKSSRNHDKSALRQFRNRATESTRQQFLANPFRQWTTTGIPRTDKNDEASSLSPNVGFRKNPFAQDFPVAAVDLHDRGRLSKTAGAVIDEQIDFACERLHDFLGRCRWFFAAAISAGQHQQPGKPFQCLQDCFMARHTQAYLAGGTDALVNAQGQAFAQFIGCVENQSHRPGPAASHQAPSERTQIPYPFKGRYGISNRQSQWLVLRPALALTESLDRFGTNGARGRSVDRFRWEGNYLSIHQRVQRAVDYIPLVSRSLPAQDFRHAITSLSWTVR
jgi:hypothetical protein